MQYIRILVKYAYIYFNTENMKNRLNITIDDALIEQVKRYAAKHRVSLSQLVEQYFRTLTRPGHRKNILELLSELPRPQVKSEADLKETYYEHRKKKYGF